MSRPLNVSPSLAGLIDLHHPRRTVDWRLVPILSALYAFSLIGEHVSNTTSYHAAHYVNRPKTVQIWVLFELQEQTQR